MKVMTSGSSTFSIVDPILWNASHVDIQKTQTILTFRKLLKSHVFSRLSCIDDELDLAWIMTLDHTEELCAAELGPPMI